MDSIDPKMPTTPGFVFLLLVWNTITGRDHLRVECPTREDAERRGAEVLATFRPSAMVIHPRRATPPRCRFAHCGCGGELIGHRPRP